MAAGSHAEKGIWALFVIAPIMINKMNISFFKKIVLNLKSLK
jgi:hypothetical protein